MLLKSIEDLHGEQGVKNLIKIKDSEKNNSLMIAVQSGNVESAKVISFYLLSIYLYIIYKWKQMEKIRSRSFQPFLKYVFVDAN